MSRTSSARTTQCLSIDAEHAYSICSLRFVRGCAIESYLLPTHQLGGVAGSESGASLQAFSGEYSSGKLQEVLRFGNRNLSCFRRARVAVLPHLRVLSSVFAAIG